MGMFTRVWCCWKLCVNLWKHADKHTDSMYSYDLLKTTNFKAWWYSFKLFFHFIFDFGCISLIYDLKLFRDVIAIFRLLSGLSFTLSPSWEIPLRRPRLQQVRDNVRDMLVKHHLFSWQLWRHIRPDHSWRHTHAPRPCNVCCLFCAC